ncbi:MAG: DUF2145 domain-containing protein [Parvibaculum sp.]
MNRNIFAIAVLIVAFTTNYAFASSNPSGTIAAPERVIPFAKMVEQELASRGARVAIVARVGRDPKDLPSGIEYTHVGLWVYSDITLPNGETVNGYAVHNLYQLGNNPDRSELVRDFPAEFFGDVYQLRAGIIVPEPAVQERLLNFISSPAYSQLHVPAYSLIANPHERKFQNCTNFVLSAVIGAVYQTGNSADILDHIRQYYQPQKIGVSGLERLFGSIFMPGVAVSDQGRDIQTSTFKSLERFMKKFNLASEAFVITEDNA